MRSVVTSRVQRGEFRIFDLEMLILGRLRSSGVMQRSTTPRDRSLYSPLHQKRGPIFRERGRCIVRLMTANRLFRRTVLHATTDRQGVVPTQVTTKSSCQEIREYIVQP